ncbi:hypothetical protein Tco_1115278 [Tanacetum coccineum]
MAPSYDDARKKNKEHNKSRMITTSELKINDEFLKILQDNTFNGMNGGDVTDHIAKVLEITEWIKMPNVEKKELRLHVFSKLLSGDAERWWNCLHKKDYFTGLTIVNDDDMAKDIVLGMKFCKKYASCQMIRKKFALVISASES